MERRERGWNARQGAGDDPGEHLARRLRTVQQRVREALDVARPGRIRTVGVCAGQGRELLGALAAHPRRGDVVARLVEADAAKVRSARGAARAAGLGRVEVLEGDPSRTDVYAGAVPAALVLVGGVFERIGDSDIARTISLLPQLCAPGAQVIWTCHGEPPERAGGVCAGFEEHGFQKRWLSSPGETAYAVGVHRFTGTPAPLESGVRMFTFGGGPRRVARE
ncbi:class I SAM-dependent methyltransferase family protein [Actinomadura viridis]|uniref:class I SAM-dependent methyltransferase family protein n=1 Tax=Actinomadura viridis TaxID=58110 RepID=UPI00367AABF1